MTDREERLDAHIPGEGGLSSAEIKDRAVRGVFTVGVRGLAIRAVGMLGNIVLARLLAPEQFGLIAFGFTFVVLGTFLTNGGIAAQVIGRSTAPSRDEWEAIFGLQLVVAVAVGVVATAVGPPLGESGAIAAIMVWSLPIEAARAPCALEAERRLDYGALVRAEVLEIVSYNLIAIALVALGAGVWGVAAATVLRAVVGTTLIVTALPPGLVRPRWAWGTVRPLLRFGVAFQGVGLISIIRDQGLVIVTGAVAGFAALGYWTIAYRLLQVIFLVIESLWRVSYPAIARLLATGEDISRPIERSLRLTAVLTGLVVACLIGAAPSLVPLLFGDRWSPAVPAIAFAAAGLMLSGPISTAAGGLLFAVGRVTDVLRAAIVHTVVWFAVATPLMPSLGATALGIGWCVAAVVDGALLARYARREVALPVLSALVRPVIGVVPAAGGAWWLAKTIPGALAGTIAALAFATLVYIGALRALGPNDLRDTYAVLKRALRRTPERTATAAVMQRS